MFECIKVTQVGNVDHIIAVSINNDCIWYLKS